MKKIKTHVCMVSAQPAPNLLPLLDEFLRPEKVVLMVTPQAKEKAVFLENVIRPLGLRIQKILLSGADNYEAIQETLLTLLSNEEIGTIALNATGGTKWMAIAAQDVFRIHGSPVFYVNIQNDTVLFLGEQKEPQKLQKRIKLDMFMNAYGYSVNANIKPQGLLPEHRELCQRLVSMVCEWEGALGQLNSLASLAEETGTLQVSTRALEQRENIYLRNVLKELQIAGLLEHREGGIVQFRDANSRTFSNGGWLEAYVNMLLNSLKSDGILQDSPRPNIVVRKVDSGSSNELDVAFIANNHLHIIECKTKRLSGVRAGMTGANTVYKLDSISSLGGLGTRSMLVSYRRLKDADHQRAKDLGIRVIEAEKIKNLKSHLRDWIQQVDPRNI